MFGSKKSSGRPGEIDVSEFSFLDDSVEFARMWCEPNGPQTFLVDPRALGADPFLFGMAMVDAVRYGAKAYAHAVNISEQEALARIWEGLDAERAKPTDAPYEVGPDGGAIQ